MNIRDLFEKMFGNQTVDKDIITYNSLVNIPDRDFFKEDQEKLDLIDSYKKQYIQDLATKKYMLSSDFSDAGLLQEVSTNMDMLVYLVMKHSDKQEMWKTNTELAANEKTERIIFYYKLELYMERLNQLELDTIMKLIALGEVRREKPFLSLVKKRAIGNFHNLLMRDVYLLISQRDAIKKEINNNFAMLNKAILDDNSTSDSDSNFLTERLAELNNIGKRMDINIVAIAEKLAELNNVGKRMDINIVDKIIDGNDRTELKVARLEREFEIYAYRNADKIREIDKELDNIRKSIGIVEGNALLIYLRRVENIYNFFDEFGRNLISEEDFYNLYLVKFMIRTHDILNNNGPLFPDANKKELECYKEIIMKRIEQIVLGKNKVINDLFGDNQNKAIRNIVNLLKLGRKEFNHEYILSNKLLLSFLLSFDNEGGFERFINETNVMVNYGDTLKIYGEKGNIFFDNILPISTILWAINICFTAQGNCKEVYRDLTCECASYILYLYNLVYKYMDKRTCGYKYHMPEGISQISSIAVKVTKINSPFISKAFDSFCRDGRGKHVYLPSTLQIISGSVFKDAKFFNIILNDGLYISGEYPYGATLGWYPDGSTLGRMQKKSDSDLVLHSDVSETSKNGYMALRWGLGGNCLMPSCTLRIPSSVDGFYGWSASIEEFVFDDFKNSKILHDKTQLADFVRDKQRKYMHAIVLVDTGGWGYEIDVDHIFNLCNIDKDKKNSLRNYEDVDRLLDAFVKFVEDNIGYKIVFVKDDRNSFRIPPNVAVHEREIKKERKLTR